MVIAIDPLFSPLERGENFASFPIIVNKANSQVWWAGSEIQRSTESAVESV